jgi:hypothetical protein
LTILGDAKRPLDLRSLAARLCRFYQAKRLKEPLKKGRKKAERIIENLYFFVRG